MLMICRDDKLFVHISVSVTLLSCVCMSMINCLFVYVCSLEHYHVFVGDVSPDIESHQLREAFAPFGQISYAYFSQLVN